MHLKTPPLLIVSSFETIRIQTNFPGMETARHVVGIAELEQPDRLGLVRDAFFAPQRFRERLRSVDAVTRETGVGVPVHRGGLEVRNEDPERLARYLNQLVFCLYSEDAGLLPEGLFTRIVAQHYRDPATFDRAIRSLFTQMATGGFSAPTRSPTSTATCSTSWTRWNLARLRCSGWARHASETGETSSRRSSGRCSSARWTHPRGRRRERTTPVPTTSSWWWNR